MWTVEDRLRGSDDEWQASTTPFETRQQAEAYASFVFADDTWPAYEWRIVGPSE